MKFDANGKRIVATPISTDANREPAYWFEQEKVDDYGFCDRPIPCDSSDIITHLCSRFRGHGGSCVALHKGEADGRKVKRLEHN